MTTQWHHLIEFQRKLLHDSVRNRSFYEAFHRVIKPGHSEVIDLGAGTGFLSFLARRLGAKSCTLIEQRPEMASLSRSIARANNILGLHFIGKHSRELKVQPYNEALSNEWIQNPASRKQSHPLMQADIVVSETLGSFAYEENIIDTMEDAKRFLKPNGVLIPCALELFVAPVIGSTVYDNIHRGWDQIYQDFKLDFSFAKFDSLSSMYTKAVPVADIYDEAKSAKRFDRVEFSSRPGENIRNSSVRTSGTIAWRMREAMVYGFCIWWKAELVPGVYISTSPLSPKTHWEQIYLPIKEPMHCKDNDEVNIVIASDSRTEVGIEVQWKAQHKRNNRILSNQDSTICQIKK
eukprot:TRINITY_DN8649_c0_g1_i1.p1 TRINITY_DN8649_c0_g1~~TRINITY_DN8649_c0_g1_i1.p1  ORF type:complete len:349 (+),score=36.00 TRINITY_DN8649_c0_g1_i1:36-1082(+)